MQPNVMTQLDLVEQQFNQVAAFLASGDAPQLETASETLQTLSVQLADLLKVPASPAVQKVVRQRVMSMAQALQVVRLNISRRSLMTEQALQVLIPAAAPKATYSGGSSVYGSVARQSGQFKVLAA